MRASVPGTFFSLVAALAAQDPTASRPQSQPAGPADPHVVVPAPARATRPAGS
jgi:hypothetical protein